MEPDVSAKKTPKSIAEVVKSDRESVGWTREELAWNSGVSVSTVQKIEGRFVLNPTVGTVDRLRGACRDQRRKLSRKRA